MRGMLALMLTSYANFVFDGIESLALGCHVHLVYKVTARGQGEAALLDDAQKGRLPAPTRLDSGSEQRPEIQSYSTLARSLLAGRSERALGSGTISWSPDQIAEGLRRNAATNYFAQFERLSVPARLTHFNGVCGIPPPEILIEKPLCDPGELGS